jgi:hypothetical protein
MTTVKTQVGKRNQKTKLNLPNETAELLKNLSMADRKAYTKRLCEAGWTYQSIADVFKVSRQAIEQYLKKCDVVSDEVLALPIPELPSEPIYRMKRLEVSADVLAELKELHAKASLVRGKSPKYRAEAEQFTKLAWEQTQQGISTYSLAKSLGVTHGALLFRFVRYGYMTTNGKSKVFRQLTHREGTPNVSSGN